MSLVRLKEMSKIYNEDTLPVTAVNAISLEIKRGEFIALVGPSGSGKTSTLNIIGALDKASKGIVEVDGNNLSQLTKKQLSDLRRNKIGFVFQSFNLIPVLTAVENAEFTLSLQGVEKNKRRKKALQALKDVGLEGLGDRRPYELSGGQQQRVAIARAIAPEPDIILADEPTANLDSKTSMDLLELMKKLNKEKKITFVFSTHDSQVMEAVNRVVNIKDGCITGESIK